MPLDGVARPAGADRGAAVQDPARDRRPEPALAHGRGADQRRRLRPRLVRRGRGPGVYRSVAPAWARREPARARRRTSSRRCSWPTCARRSARRCRRPTATRSATATGCSCTTATSPTSTLLRRDLMLAIDPDAVRRRPGLDRHRGGLPPRADLRARGGPDRRARADGRARSRRRRRRHGVDGRGAGELRRLGRRAACGRCATRPRARRARCSPRPTSDAIRRLHPENPRFQRLSADDRLIVSEPFSDLPGVWHEIPESTAVTVRHGGVLEQRPFQPMSD